MRLWRASLPKQSAAWLGTLGRGGTALSREGEAGGAMALHRTSQPGRPSPPAAAGPWTPAPSPARFYVKKRWFIYHDEGKRFTAPTGGERSLSNYLLRRWKTANRGALTLTNSKVWVWLLLSEINGNAKLQSHQGWKLTTRFKILNCSDAGWKRTKSYSKCRGTAAFLFFKDMRIYLEKEKLLCRYESKDIPSEVNIIPLLSKFINNKCTIFLLSLAAGGEVVSKHSFFQIN